MTSKENIKHGLKDINKEGSFKVPGQYFENFSARMSERISASESAKAPRHEIAWFRPQYAAIVVFAGIALFLYFKFDILNQHKNKPLSAKEMAEVYEYSALNDLNDDQLAQILSDRQRENNENSDTLLKTDEKYQDEIIEYLSKENIDINTILDTQ